MRELENGVTLWLIAEGTPATGFTYRGPYESEDAARFEVEQWQGFDGEEELQIERDTWIMPMRYRKGHHVGALKIGLED